MSTSKILSPQNVPQHLSTASENIMLEEQLQCFSYEAPKHLRKINEQANTHQDLEMANNNNNDFITFAFIKEKKNRSKESIHRSLLFKDLEMANNNNDLITFANIQEHKELILDNDEKLEAQHQCCIYRVPKNLRKMNEEAYTPQVISIGPLHHFNEELCAMEKQKIRFVREFGKRIEEEFDSRIKEETWQKLINFIAEKEVVIRNCYAEMPKQKFDKMKFIEMILYDAVFIIEYLLRYPQIYSESSMSNVRRVSNSIWNDLLLLENQLPYFVLKRQYKLAFSEHGGVYPPFFELASRLVFADMNSRISKEKEDVQKKWQMLLSDLSREKFNHFTDMRRCAMIRMQHVELQSGEIDIPCAVKLQESGVKFKRFKGSECLLDIRVQKKMLPWIPFNSPELQIPKIEIYDETECFFRNLMALEQCHYPDKTHICNYIYLMDKLINTEADVNLLVEEGIISNFVGENARIAETFNKLCLHIVLSNSCYYVENGNYLKEYSKIRWNLAKATLRRVYFCNRWRGTATVAAILLLVLTVIQTICSIKSVV